MPDPLRSASTFHRSEEHIHNSPHLQTLLKKAAFQRQCLACIQETITAHPELHIPLHSIATLYVDAKQVNVYIQRATWASHVQKNAPQLLLLLKKEHGIYFPASIQSLHIHLTQRPAK